MGYNVLYGKGNNKTKVLSKRPVKPHKGFGFAEGPFKTKKAVKIRINQMKN